MDEKQLKQEALQLIEEYFGQYTKKLYARFYEEKPAETVFASLEELLNETLGTEKAQNVIQPLREKYSLKTGGEEIKGS